MFTFRLRNTGSHPSCKPTYFFHGATKPRHGELLPIEIDTVEQAIIDLLSALRLRNKRSHIRCSLRIKGN